jgi:transcriptional regulator with XRE-family HTH domain
MGDNFGRRLYTLMLRRGFSQTELARKSGMPRESVSSLIRGYRTPSAEEIGQLAAGLDAPLSDLDVQD